MTVKELRLSTGMTQQEFADYFCIPKRTIEDWEGNRRTPPEYVVQLIKYKIEKEDMFMKTVTIYKITSTQAYSMKETGERYSLQPWGKNTDYYKGFDDGGKEYMIPHGYTVEMGNDEQLHFYDKGGNYVKLITYNGRPALEYDPYPLILKRKY